MSETKYPRLDKRTEYVVQLRWLNEPDRSAYGWLNLVTVSDETMAREIASEQNNIVAEYRLVKRSIRATEEILP